MDHRRAAMATATATVMLTAAHSHQGDRPHGMRIIEVLALARRCRDAVWTMGRCRADLLRAMIMAVVLVHLSHHVLAALREAAYVLVPVLTLDPGLVPVRILHTRVLLAARLGLVLVL